jgi:hypothetical protein
VTGVSAPPLRVVHAAIAAARSVDTAAGRSPFTGLTQGARGTAIIGDRSGTRLRATRYAGVAPAKTSNVRMASGPGRREVDIVIGASQERLHPQGCDDGDAKTRTRFQDSPTRTLSDKKKTLPYARG